MSLQITSIRAQPSQSLGIHQGDNLATIINQLVLLRRNHVELQNTDLTLLLTGASASPSGFAVSYQDSLCGQQVQYPVIAMRVEGMPINLELAGSLTCLGN